MALVRALTYAKVMACRTTTKYAEIPTYQDAQMAIKQDDR